MDEPEKFSDSSPSIKNMKNKNQKQKQLSTNIKVIAESVVDEEEIVGRPNNIKINSINGVPIAHRAEDDDGEEEEEEEENYVSGISLGEQNQNSDSFINPTAEAQFC